MAAYKREQAELNDLADFYIGLIVLFGKPELKISIYIFLFFILAENTFTPGFDYFFFLPIF